MRRGLILPDTHLGHEDRRLLELVGQFTESHRWDFWIHIGDLLDMESIAPFNQERPGIISRALPVLEELERGNGFLNHHLRAARSKNPLCDAYFIQGNHEERLQRLVDAHPMFKGLEDIPRQLKLNERKVKWIPYWSTGEMLRIGKLWLAHGFKTNQHHAAAMVRDHGVSIVYGHTHDTQRFPVKRLSDKSVIFAQSLGCLCDLNPPWMKGRPQNWSHAFGVLNVFPDGNFQLQVVDIFRYRFVSPIDGRLWVG